MARRSNAAGSAEKTLPAIVNQGYFSDYFLSYRLDVGLDDLYRRWDAAERNGDLTARTRVRSLSAAFDKFRVDAVLTSPDTQDSDARLALALLPIDGVAALRDLNDAILSTLGWVPRRDATVTLTSGDKTLHVPVAHRCDTASGLVLLAVDAVFATDPTTIVADKAAAPGTLLEPVRVGDKAEGRTVLEAAQLIFTADDPPSYLLICSGGSITLLDRDRWGEGVFLAADLDDAVARNDNRARGELAAIAALFSADVINPGDDAQSVLAGLLDKAANESAGVSKELRHGVRRSVELLANAVIHDVRHRQRGAWQQIDPNDLTGQSLRYLYRIIVLLFAEARPELGILPVDDSDYQAGYSLARLRDTALTDLHGDHARNSTHLQQSLAVLFRLVNDGYEPEITLDDARGLSFPGLGSALFADTACPLLDRARITDGTLQQVLVNLCFTREKVGKSRQALSYATLGINQLGAVYEGLMAYKGFLATEELFEIDNDGDADNGSWVIPVHRADEFADELFAMDEGHDGQPRRVRYQTGDFVYRLSGRDRQRSASYYTPEVLTEFTVRHALDVYFAENPHLSAAELLDITVCEPALGSGAFLNEAITQLATRYLKAAQDERGVTIDPSSYRDELQKTKAHFAVNQAFGVDLNQTAVELAEVSIWLNCMHKGLRAPWLGARLRRGNSLIGARRATYSIEQVRSATWAAGRPAAAQELDRVPFHGTTGVHHFLVPGEGWGAAHRAAEIKEMAPSWASTVRVWQQRIHAKPTRRQVERLQGLAERVEVLWERSASEIAQFWTVTRQHIDVWGNPTAPTGSRFGDEAIRRVLTDHRSPTCRLRTVMNAWCSLWAWSPQHGLDLPTLDDWLDAVEMVVGRPDAHDTGALFNEASPSVDEVGQATEIDRAEEAHPWLVVCRELAEQQAWFHWELEFSPAALNGGFHLQIGNPPWVRPRWSDEASLAEYDPWFGVTSPIPEGLRRTRRHDVLLVEHQRVQYLGERAENESLNTLMGATSIEPLLAGQQNNLYLLFITGTWRRIHPRGAAALIHPEGHLTDPKAGNFRGACYRRLREHWHFINELMLFREISDTREYGVHVYGSDRATADFLQAAFLYHPSVVDRSLGHDGEGELPGRKHPTGEWDVRPHAQRLVRVDDETLQGWASLLAHPDPATAPLVRTVTSAEAAAADAIARYPHRLGNTTYYWSAGWHEQTAPRRGIVEARTARPDSWNEVILQGPHIGICNPFAKQPHPSGKHQQDYEPWDLVALPQSVIPRTNWQRQMPRKEFEALIDYWDGVPHIKRYRAAGRTMVPSNTYRSIFVSLIPPGATTMSGLYVGGQATDRETVLFAAMAAGLLTDFFARVTAVANLHANVIERFPRAAEKGPLEEALIHRTLRLSCLTREFAPLWKALRRSAWEGDEPCSQLTIGFGQPPIEWTPTVPVRAERDRWALMAEIDALGALVLGVEAAGLVAVYRSQFPVLRAYESHMVFDGNGHQIAKDHHAHGFIQARWEAENKSRKLPKGEKKRGIWERVQAYLDGDLTVNLGPFEPPFTLADRETAMTNAYWAFVGRYELTPTDLGARPA
jgi:hypothetical protein